MSERPSKTCSESAVSELDPNNNHDNEHIDMGQVQLSLLEDECTQDEEDVCAVQVQTHGAGDTDTKTTPHLRVRQYVSARVGLWEQGSSTSVSQLEMCWMSDYVMLHPFDALPTWMQDNQYIRGRHRPHMPQFAKCVSSIFVCHAETGNIWTHLLGCLAFVIIAIVYWCRPTDIVPWEEKLVISVFFCGAVVCLGFSCTFHTFACHSPEWSKLLAKLDYVGICALVFGSFIPWLYYDFYCDKLSMGLYIGAISVLTIASIVVSCCDRFATPKYRPVRAGLFIVTGLTAVVPSIHYGVMFGASALIEKAKFHYLAVMAALYIGGALLYAFRVPERFSPGRFDLFFQSHQIFHVCVIVAALVHLGGISQVAQITHATGCPPYTVTQENNTVTIANATVTLVNSTGTILSNHTIVF